MGPAIRSNGTGVRDQWNQQAAPDISGGRRVWIFVGRWTVAVRARKYLRGVLYTASVARNFPGVWIAVRGESWVQPGSRAGDCTDATVALGILSGDPAKAQWKWAIWSWASAIRDLELRTMVAKRRVSSRMRSGLWSNMDSRGIISLPMLRAQTPARK
jgi:hypothetical protein